MKCAWLTLIALWGMSAGLAAQEAPPVTREDKSLLPTLELQDGDSIVFLGDSITAQRLYTQYVEDYFYTRFPHLRLKMHNAGVGGARAWDALQRFEQDVAKYKPKYVTVLLGMNDGTYQSYNHEIFTTYQQDMTQLLDQLAEIDAIPVVITPTMFDARAERLRKDRAPREAAALYNSTLAYYGTWLREVAADRGHGFVDMWHPLNAITNDQRKKDPKFTLIKDAVHPDAPGQVVMATAIIDDLDLPTVVSSVRLNKGNGGKWNPTVQNAEIGEITETPEGLSFTLTAKSLPWVLPAEAALGVELTKLGHRFSREVLRVNGLEPGGYQLTIDGVDCGIYRAPALAQGIELQGNSQTPQYQQALKVAELNKQRNEGPVRALRGEWSQFQQYARAKRAAEAKPEDQGLQKQLAANQKKIEGSEARVEKANADARAIEDEIFKINQPTPRKYVLTKVK